MADSGSGNASIQGFATDISVNRGSTIGFKVKTTSTSYRLDIYRMGYYGGDGRPEGRNGQSNRISEPAGLSEPKQHRTDRLRQLDGDRRLGRCRVPRCLGSISHTWSPPPAQPRATSSSLSATTPVTSDLFFQTSDTTWQAYNDYGGNSLYEGSPAGRAYKVSYNRPFDTNAETPEDFVWNSEYPMVRFLEANGYDVSYTTGVDTERRGNLITNHKTFLSVGHDEYWSGGQRTNVEAARDAGVNLAFFSGNEVFWKTRWENSISTGSAHRYRTLVTYKETHANAKIDPDARLDRYVAGSAVQPSGRRRTAGKRA